MSRKSSRNQIAVVTTLEAVASKKRNFALWVISTLVLLCLTAGVMGHYDLLPAGSTSFLAAAPVPTPTPQLSREYIYTSNGRLIAAEDAGAQQVTATDLAVWRLSSGTWFIMSPTGAVSVQQQWGIGTDTPAPGDYDGDGKTDFCVFRPDANGAFYALRSSDAGLISLNFGTTGDVPAPGDYDGDGRTDFAVYRPSDGAFYVLQSGDGSLLGVPVGITNDLPTAGDYDGDGKTDGAVWRNSTATFYIKRSSDGATVSQVAGQSGDTPAPGDYDGDGRFDFTVFRAGTWYVLTNPSTGSGSSGPTPFGLPTDTLVQGDYDADGKTDIAVWRAGVWYILKSSNGQTRIETFGVAGDIPVPAPYRR
jgi:hypothetical protein